MAKIGVVCGSGVCFLGCKTLPEIDAFERHRDQDGVLRASKGGRGPTSLGGPIFPGRGAGIGTNSQAQDGMFGS